MLLKTRASLKEQMKYALDTGASPWCLWWRFGGQIWVARFDKDETVCYRSRRGLFFLPETNCCLTVGEFREFAIIRRRMRWPEILVRSVWEGLKWVCGQVLKRSSALTKWLKTY